MEVFKPVQKNIFGGSALFSIIFHIFFYSIAQVITRDGRKFNVAEEFNGSFQLPQLIIGQYREKILLRPVI
ncbi:hypothetical protein SDC9_189144 [bioreactor metagenome]|uniref:Uncharacterized protein n=1 Tax=bioreactor metagenome TaxID=1076179 RepID=A0A645HRW7_9ZZZZ